MDKDGHHGRDNIPIQNKERDKAWEAFIKRKDVKALMKENSDFKFPLNGSYEMWCIAWDKAWDTAVKTAQKQWVGLTEIEICDIEADELTSASSETFSFARAIEEKLKEKNHG